MRQFRQLLSLFLAIAMVFSLVVPAYAQEEESGQEPPAQTDTTATPSQEGSSEENYEVIEEAPVLEEEPASKQEPVPEEAPSFGLPGMAAFSLMPYAEGNSREIPVIRDSDGKMSGSELYNKLKNAGLNLPSQANRYGICPEGSSVQALGTTSVTLQDNVTYRIKTRNNAFSNSWTDTEFSFRFELNPAPSIQLVSGQSITVPRTASGTVDVTALKEVLFKAVYETSTPTMGVADVTITYQSGDSFVALNSAFADAQSRTIRIKFGGNNDYREGSADVEVSINADTRTTVTLAPVENQTVSMIFTADGSKDYAALKNAIFRKVVTAEPAGLITADDVTITYVNGNNSDAPLAGQKNGLGFQTIQPIDGGNGDSRTIKVVFSGNASYASGNAEPLLIPITLVKDSRRSIQAVDGFTYKLVTGEQADSYAVMEAATGLTAQQLSGGKLTVQYLASARSYKDLNAAPGIGQHKFGDNDPETVQITFSGNLEYQSLSATVSVHVVDPNMGATSIAVKGASVEIPCPHFAGSVPSVKQVKAAILDSTNPAEIADALVVQYERTVLLNTSWEPLTDSVISSSLNNGLKLRLHFNGTAEYQECTSDSVQVTFPDTRTTPTIKLRESPVLGIDGTGVTAQGVFDAIVESTDPQLTAADVTIQYAAMQNTNQFFALDYEPKTSLAHKFGANNAETVRITFPGNDTLQSTELTVTLAIEHQDNVTIALLTEQAVVDYGQNNPTVEDVFQAIFDGENSSSILSRENLKVQYYSLSSWQNLSDAIIASSLESTLQIRLTFAGATVDGIQYRAGESQIVSLSFRDTRTASQVAVHDAEVDFFPGMEKAPSAEDLFLAVYDSETSVPANLTYDPQSFAVLYQNGYMWDNLTDSVVQNWKSGQMNVRIQYLGGTVEEEIYAPSQIQEATITFCDTRDIAMTEQEEALRVLPIVPDGTAEPQKILEAAVVIAPESGLTVADVTIEYQSAGVYVPLTYAPLTDVGHKFGAQETEQVRITFQGNQSYQPQTLTTRLTITDGREPAEIVLKANQPLSMVFDEEKNPDYEALAQKLFAQLYDAEASIPALTYSDVTITYRNTQGQYIPLDGNPTIDSDQLLDIFGNNRIVRVAFAGNETYMPADASVTVQLIKDGREAASVAYLKNVSISYSADSAAMEQELFDKVIDWENSNLPAKETLSIEDFDIAYRDNAFSPWFPVAGSSLEILGAQVVPQLPVGQHSVRLVFKGNDDFTATSQSDTGVTVNVQKASVRLNVHSTSIYADQALPAGFITNSANADLGTITVFTGLTNSVSLAVYVDLPFSFRADNPLVAAVDPIITRILGFGIQDIMREGITLGQLRKLALTDEILDLMKLFNYDSSIPAQVLQVIDNMPSITDNVRIGVGKPTHVGLYNVTAITTNPNYNTAIGTGTLLVKLRLIGVKLTWNESLPYIIKSSELADTDFGATLSFNGDTTISQSNVKYRFTGFSGLRLYSSTKAPTAPGTYTVTAYTQGGNHTTLPIVRTFRVVKG